MLSLDKQNQLREQFRAHHTGWRPATEVYANEVRMRLTPTALLLDIGCGRGGLVEQLTHPLSQMMGVDPDTVSLQEHRLGMPRATAFDALPFAANQFDVVFAAWVLEHWQSPSDSLAEIVRVLKPNGAFVFITPNKQHPLILLNRVLGSAETAQKTLVHRLYGREEDDTFPIHYRASTLATLRQLAQRSGLTLTTLHTIPDPTYLAFTPSLFRLMCWLDGFVPEEKQLHLVGVMEKES